MTEFEKIFLGTILGTTSKISLYDESGIRAEMFSTDIGKKVYSIIGQLIEDGITPTILEVYAKDKSIPLETLSMITNNIGVDIANGAVKNIKKDYQNRMIKRLSAIVLDSDKNGYNMTLDAIHEVLNCIDDVSAGKDMVNAKDLLNEYTDQLERRVKGLDNAGVEIRDFSRMKDLYHRFENGCIYYIGARPSDGKSTLAMNIANTCLLNNVKTGFITIESGRFQLLSRMYSHQQRIHHDNIRKGMLRQNDLLKLQDFGESFYKNDFIIYDKPNATIHDVKSIARQMVRKYKIQILFIDYVQLIKYPKYKTRAEEVGAVSTELKQLARTLNIPIIALAQLKRDVDGRMPNLGDFQWASQLEQDMDGGFLIWNINNEPSKPDQDDYYLLYAKNRDGAKGWSRMLYSKDIMTFREHKDQFPPIAQKTQRKNY